jgi:hypothetical protein
MVTALPGVMRYKNPTPNPLPASDEGAKMYLIRAETAVTTKNHAWGYCDLIAVIDKNGDKL